uniref:Natriuretic peptides A-like n=1 Tax=Coturnix japonica TaxID=93934 RepID=A0A8C2T3I5_COTJA
MQLLALCCRTSLLLLFMPWAGGENDAELQSLQELLEALEQLQEEEGAPALEDELGAGAEIDGSEGALLPAPSPPQPEEGQSQWRSLLSSYRRRQFSGCFGTRMERIGAQTGLGCNHYKARFWRRRRS